MRGGKEVVGIFFVVLSLLFVQNVSGLGVSPGGYSLDFVPGYEGNFYFNFDNADGGNLEIFADGDLAKYVTLSNAEITGSGRVEVSLKLPQEIEPPGNHRIFIGARPVFTGEGTIGAVANVRGTIFVLVPFPGEYADVVFVVENANSGEKIPYELEIFSRGVEDLSTNSRIEIFDFKNDSVEVFNLGNDLVPSTKSVTKKSELDVRGYNPGTYRAVATVSYSGDERKQEGDFRLGELFVEIVNYSEVFGESKINPFEITVESFWNDPIENVHAKVDILGSEVSFLTPSINLNGFETGKLIGFFDTSEIEGDSFQALITLNYEGKTTQKTVDLGYSGGGTFNYIWLLVGAGILLVLAFVGWVVVKLRRLDKKSGKKKK